MIRRHRNALLIAAVFALYTLFMLALSEQWLLFALDVTAIAAIVGVLVVLFPRLP